MTTPRPRASSTPTRWASYTSSSKINRGEDLGGNPIGEPPGFLIGTAFNPTAEDLDAEIDKLRRKTEAGAHAFWTQPVFEIKDLESALEKLETLDLNPRLLLGLMPLRSARQAEFLHHEVPGINIPRHVRERLAELSPEDAPKYGVEVAQGLLVKAQPLVNGAYIMPPASAPDLAGDVIEVVDQSVSASVVQSISRSVGQQKEKGWRSWCARLQELEGLVEGSHDSLWRYTERPPAFHGTKYTG